jgi:hypothetical protein
MQVMTQADLSEALEDELIDLRKQPGGAAFPKLHWNISMTRPALKMTVCARSIPTDPMNCILTSLRPSRKPLPRWRR